MTYLNHALNSKETPQTEAIPGSNQEQNNAGGFSWKVSDWTRLDRFLMLGSEGGTYYQVGKTLTRENAQAVLRCIEADGLRTVDRAVEISTKGRAPKNDPALFVLAAAMSYGSTITRHAAAAGLPQVARIGTHLLHFAAYVDGMRGWGRLMRTAIGRWYTDKDAAALAYQAVKYAQRDGWSHRDLLRLAHPKALNPDQQEVLHWIVKGWPAVGDIPHPNKALQQIWAAQKAKRAASAAEVVQLIHDFDLPREAVPSEWLNTKEVWQELVDSGMPLTALIRNLATLTRHGIIAPDKKSSVKRIAAAITDEEALKRARVHPIAILAALITYQSGASAFTQRAHRTWSPVPLIVDALDEAFYMAFKNVEPTGKRWVLALDVSGSMDSGNVSGIPGLTPRMASAALAMVTARTEPDHTFLAFTSGPRGVSALARENSGITTLSLSPRQRLDDVVKAVKNLPFGWTDCALPMLWALDNKVEADVFVILTDSETWAGSIHPAQALRDYRKQSGIPARMAVVGMVSSGFTIADPNDAGMMDFAGFDTATPELLSMFVKGEL